jgi:hypothetical protein
MMNAQDPPVGRNIGAVVLGESLLPRGTQIIGRRVQVGLRYAGQIVTIEVDDTTLRVYDPPQPAD